MYRQSQQLCCCKTERLAALTLTEEAGEMQHVGVDVRELVRSQCSSSRSISSDVGPPSAGAVDPIALSPFLAKNSRAVVRSHIWFVVAVGESASDDQCALCKFPQPPYRLRRHFLGFDLGFP